MEKQRKTNKNSKSNKTSKVIKTTKTRGPGRPKKVDKVTKTTSKTKKDIPSKKVKDNVSSKKALTYPIELLQDNLKKSDKSSFCCYYPKGKDSLVVITPKKTDYSISFEDNLVTISMPEENFNISSTITELQIVTNNKHDILYIAKESSDAFKIITNNYIKLPYLKIANKSSQSNFIETILDKEILNLSIINNVIEFTYKDPNAKKDESQSSEAETVEATEVAEQPVDNAPQVNQISVEQQVSSANNVVTPAVQVQAVQPENVVANKIDDKPQVQVTEPNISENATISDNNELLISENTKKVFLPYTVKDLNKKLNSNSKYKSLEDVINSEYIVSTDKYKSPIISRFREAYNLIKKKEHGSIKEAIDLGFELMLQSNLHPAIISACKNLDELDIYLDCLDDNDVNSFSCFNIKYDVPPRAKH